MFCPACGKEVNEEMKYCCYCGKTLENSIYTDDLIFPEDITDICEHKEDYTIEKLYETVSWLNEHGFIEKAEELKKYIASMHTESNKDQSYGKGNIWITYMKTVLYISLVIDVIIGMVIGSAIFRHEGLFIVGLLLGGGAGFLVGFILIASFMLIITLCENVMLMTNNTAKILEKLSEKETE